MRVAHYMIMFAITAAVIAVIERNYATAILHIGLAVISFFHLQG